MSDSRTPAEKPAPSSGANKIWEPPPPEMLQAVMPQFEVSSLLGRGGMGAVYKGRQLQLDRPVAIKILPPDLDDQGYVERFKNEARAMAKLNHPGIVRVFQSGETYTGMLYIVMEFVDGTDVARMVVEKGRLHSLHALAITAHVCDALQYAHQRGIIHRDIKPSNIMVGADGVVRVADFGLAKLIQTDGSSGLTRSGTALGTLQFMAPEALTLGSAVDHRADIYAVGVTLYYMLTGRLPQGVFEMPSLRVPGLDPRLDVIIAKALRDDREQRYQNIGELRADMDGVMTQPLAQVSPEASGVAAALPPTVVRAQPEQLRQRPPVVMRRDAGKGMLWVAILLLSGLLLWLGGPKILNLQSTSTSGPVSAPPPSTALMVPPASNSGGLSVLVPKPLHPAFGELMDNGSQDRVRDTQELHFSWSPVSGATKYQVEAWRLGSGRPLVQAEVSGTEFKQSNKAYVAMGNCHGWRWKVRAFVQNQWQAWSEDVGFEFEPPDYDLTTR